MLSPDTVYIKKIDGLCLQSMGHTMKLFMVCMLVFSGCSITPEEDWSENPVTNNPFIIRDSRPMMGVPMGEG